MKTKPGTSFAPTNGAADLPEPHFGEGRYLGLAFRSDAYSVAQAQALFASHGKVPAQQPAPSPAATVGNSGFDYQTAADVLNGKTVSDEAIRKFVAASRRAHDDRSGLRATLLSVRGELASREAEIALLKNALMDAEEPQPPTTQPQADSQPAIDTLAEAECFIDNPSAWSHFDQRASDAMAAVCKAFRAARATADSDLITIRKPTTQAEVVWLAKLAHLLVSDVNYTLGAMLEPKADSVLEDAERYRNAIASACEGWTMPDGLRKHLETALWSPPTPQPTQS